MIWLYDGRSLAQIRHYLKPLFANYVIGLFLSLSEAIQLRFPIHTNTYSSDHNKIKYFQSWSTIKFYLLFKHD